MWLDKVEVASSFMWRLFFKIRLNGLFSHYRPRAILQRNLKIIPSRILNSIITWSLMGQKTAQSKKIY